MHNIIFFTNHDEFYAWLEQHHTTSDELWVGYHRKGTKRASLTWSESVDAALCFGWIDGVRKSIDDQSYKIRFTPRKTSSIWSAVNVQKVQELLALGKMSPAGMHLYDNRNDAVGYTSNDRNIPLSDHYAAQIKASPAAWNFLENLAPSYRRDSIWWVMSAKKQETQLRRLGILIASCEAGLKIPSLRKK